MTDAQVTRGRLFSNSHRHTPHDRGRVIKGTVTAITGRKLRECHRPLDREDETTDPLAQWCSR